MISIEQIQQLHLELSSKCNARCPLCPRNVGSFPYNAGYKETNMSFELFENKITPKFISQLNHILLNGNFGDFTNNLEAIKIIEHLRKHNQKLSIVASTNGSTRNSDFWKALAKLKVEVQFCLDGLEDTHHLYRIDTNFDTILKNAQTFIAAGGQASWKMIKFDHNQHQIDECRLMAKKLKFKDFILTDQGRNHGPVFDRKTGNLLYKIGNKDYPSFKNAKQLIAFNEKVATHKKLSDQNYDFDTSVKPKCYTQNAKSVYISADAKVYPCCWVGFSPQTYRYLDYNIFNKQTTQLEKNNDLNHNDLETCIKWFTDIESSWNKKSHEDGRLLVCDSHCNNCAEVRKRETVSLTV